MWSPGSYFTLFKQFYWRNGNIHLKGLQWNFRKGIWYEFDMDGNLVGQTDYDAPYAFTWEDVLEFCYKAPEGWRRLLIGLNLSVCGYEAFFLMIIRMLSYYKFWT